jgi:hypothetical protein
VTAEVAILNKAAVALAADSAVTISAGSDQQKIFDSADKLFELSNENPIAVMVNSDMSFMEAPIAVLIKRYRESAPRFARVRDAANHFLHYLNDFIAMSPGRIEKDAVETFAESIFASINSRARESWTDRVFDPDSNKLREEFAKNPDKLSDLVEEMHAVAYEDINAIIERIPDAAFFDGVAPTLDASLRKTLNKAARENLPVASVGVRRKCVNLIERAMRKRGVMGNTTGLVIAGFGDDDLFPTLISFELYGVGGGKLKFAEINMVDIDRDGDKARVMPFAQREMVERFLYGLDGGIERQITEFAQTSVPSIAEELIGALDMPDDDKAALKERALEAEDRFYHGLKEKAFEAIRAESRSEIEDMVEFMPKPEMARMAEALVNLTSIKRRVSRGHETVGGPIDVAVISKAEGFVWVKRKHYFPQELNQRYFDRMRPQTARAATEE